MLLTPASRTQKTKARAFVTICWVDRIETNKISKNVGFFPPTLEETYGSAECGAVK